MLLDQSLAPPYSVNENMKVGVRRCRIGALGAQVHARDVGSKGISLIDFFLGTEETLQVVRYGGRPYPLRKFGQTQPQDLENESEIADPRAISKSTGDSGKSQFRMFMVLKFE